MLPRCGLLALGRFVRPVEKRIAEFLGALVAFATAFATFALGSFAARGGVFAARAALVLARACGACRHRERLRLDFLAA